MASHYAAGSKISLNNRLKIRFIRRSATWIERKFAAGFERIFSP
jgi:hypothetical protein